MNEPPMGLPDEPEEALGPPADGVYAIPGPGMTIGEAADLGTILFIRDGAVYRYAGDGQWELKRG